MARFLQGSILPQLFACEGLTARGGLRVIFVIPTA
jgi:hypothetical protein